MLACWYCASLLVSNLGSPFLPHHGLGNAEERSIGPTHPSVPTSVRFASTCRPRLLVASRSSGRTLNAAESRDEDCQDQTGSASPTLSSPSSFACGTYRSIGEAVWQKLTTTAWLEPCKIPQALLANEAPTKGMKGWMTRIETRALKAKDSTRNPPHVNPIRYARMALIETVPIDSQGDDDAARQSEGDISLVHTKGIQVLNVVIFPRRESSFPVWGADFVSLPGDKHLILLDAQPVDAGVRTGDRSAFDAHWLEWYQRHQVASRFPWGGDLPDPVKPFVSSNALWTRFVPPVDEKEKLRVENSVDIIRKDLPYIVESHLDIYLGLLSDGVLSSSGSDLQADYIRYRRDNDPARPMLKALYGEEWTESVLNNILFPQNF